MKTDKIYLFLLIAVFSIQAISCNRMLDIAPENKLTREKFWQKKEDAVSAIIGTYSTLRSNQEAFLYWGEVRGELLNSIPGKGAGTDKESIDVFLIQPSNVMNKYTNFYKVINQANLVIKNIPGIVAKDPSFSTENANQIMGEAYFLRAFTYFWLARTFKEVPLILEPSESDGQNYNVIKSPFEVIMTQVLADIKLAENSLPVAYDSDVQTKGRATRYAAYAFEADVDLWLGKNQEAIAACDMVINSKQFALLTPTNLGNLFTPGNTGESIWELQYNNSLNQTHSLYTWFNNKPYFSGNPVFSLFDDPVDARIVTSITPGGSVQKYNISTNDAHWIFYRYADVILMKAEALAHLVPDNVANLSLTVKEINKIRSRAGIALIPVISNTQQADEFLLDERGRELCFEGKRWFDLVRFASRNNFAGKDMLISRIVSAVNGVDQLVIRTRVDNPESWYLPLHVDALSSNSLLVQNPYYQ
ncbi:MAG: RagB/SusD family nutrient uptake outer membrane protein [Candidatus Pedobacter colombiensis]|uniref:RagB/SusD family nutrient uptake outer membrane protein n=1 Tax=Candidatus Pedobacter colombiensis TaxID=3121371 RepID=A0AAJ5W9W7_9SPHI|nr:RagB/SusD family nutrient uptake outer membrane protein [Pedobacter sp.]WEK19963.1 MAG: RagB/SusD family nutrient uptake outer membrane protein [Pedobacter sp.]